MRGINDQAWRADLLGDVLNSYGDWGWVHVNLIPLNPTPGSKWTASDPRRRARVRPPARGQGHPDHRPRHPRPRDRRRLRPARRRGVARGCRCPPRVSGTVHTTSARRGPSVAATFLASGAWTCSRGGVAAAPSRPPSSPSSPTSRRPPVPGGSACWSSPSRSCPRSTGSPTPCAGCWSTSRPRGTRPSSSPRPAPRRTPASR